MIASRSSTPTRSATHLRQTSGSLGGPISGLPLSPNSPGNSVKRSLSFDSQTSSKRPIETPEVDPDIRRMRAAASLSRLTVAKFGWLAGSSDQTIRIWRGSTCTDTFTGHSDTFRGLAFLPDIGILSASHDCTVRLWSESGEVLQEMVGHTAIVYSVAVNSVGEVASGSEDGEAKIWRGSITSSLKWFTKSFSSFSEAFAKVMISSVF